MVVERDVVYRSGNTVNCALYLILLISVYILLIRVHRFMLHRII